MKSNNLLKLLGLGTLSVFLGLTGCDKKPVESDSESESQSQSESQQESQSEKESESQSVSESQSESESVSESESESGSTSESGSEQEETVVKIAFDFNYYNGTNFTVWTNEEVAGSVAPQAEGNSLLDVSEYHTIGSFGQEKCYTFVVDSNGFIEMATYGVGAGWGGPWDGMYVNVGTDESSYKSINSLTGDQADTKIDYFDFWRINPNAAAWPGVTTISGTQYNAWNLYDLIIPEGGFIISASTSSAELTKFWQDGLGLSGKPQNGNSQLEGSVAKTSLDKFYVYLNEDRELCVRERKENETKTYLEEHRTAHTDSINFETTSADAVVEYVSVSDAVTDALKLSNDGKEKSTEDYTVKGVITAIHKNNNAVISDGKKNILIYSSAIGTQDATEFKVGETVAMTGKLCNYNGTPEILPEKVTKINGYGTLNAIDPFEVNEENAAATFVNESNLLTCKVIKAEVVSINLSGESTLKVGQTSFIVYKAKFGEEIAEGDFVDIIVTLYLNKGSISTSMTTAADVARYYKLTVKDEGAEADVVKGFAAGEKVSLIAKGVEGKTFTGWVSVDSEGAETPISNESTYEVTVSEDVVYLAKYVASPWTSLNEYYKEVATYEVMAKNDDKEFSVWTEGTIIRDGSSLKDGALDITWRAVAVFDADGMLCYGTYMLGNGFGFYTNPKYEGHNDLNPAFVMEGETISQVKVPEGGFALTGWNESASGANKIMELCTGGFYNNSDNMQWHCLTALEYRNGFTRQSNGVYYPALTKDYSSVRCFYVQETGMIKSFREVIEREDAKVAEGATYYQASLNVDGYQHTGNLGVFIDTDANTFAPTYYTDSTRHEFYTAWRFVVAVDAEGRVIYASYALNQGYGSVADSFYTRTDDYAVPTYDASNPDHKGALLGDFFYVDSSFKSWNEDSAAGAYGNYDALVPTNGFVIVGWNGDAEVCNLIRELFGDEVAELNFDDPTSFNDINDGVADNFRVHAVLVDGELNIKVVAPTQPTE